MKKFILFVATVLFCGQAVAVQQNSYYSLDRTYLKINGEYQPVAGFDNFTNVIEVALKSPTGTVPFSSSNFVSAAKDALDEIKGDSYLQNLVINNDLLVGSEKYIANFVCKEYSFKHALPEIERCDSIPDKDDPVEKVPFSHSGSNIDIWYDGEKAIYHFTSPNPSLTKGARNGEPSSSLWHPVHTLGSYVAYHGNNRHDIILTVSLDIYKKKDDYRGDKINKETIALFFIIPSSAKISSANSMKQAVKETISNAKILRTKG